MSNFGQAEESGEGFVNKLYTGIENFKVTHVCPSQEELQSIFGENAKEDTYILTNNDGHKQVKIVLYLDNMAEEGEPSIKTRVTFFVTNAPRLTNDGSKTQHINVYGKTAWLAPDAVLAPSGNYELQGGKGVYILEGKGVRPAFQGEEALIGFIRNLLNLPSLKNAKDPSQSESQFSVNDWNVMFTGNFSSIKNVIMSSPNKVGLVLGVKTVESGSMYQDVYNRGSLRQWAKNGKKFTYIRKELTDAQTNGAYPNTVFGNPDFVLREYTADAAPTNEAALVSSNAAPAKSFFSTANKSSFTSDVSSDDVPF